AGVAMRAVVPLGSDREIGEAVEVEIADSGDGYAEGAVELTGDRADDSSRVGPENRDRRGAGRSDEKVDDAVRVHVARAIDVPPEAGVGPEPRALPEEPAARAGAHLHEA